MLNIYLLGLSLSTYLKIMDFYSYFMSKQELEQVSTETVINCWVSYSYKSRML